VVDAAAVRRVWDEVLTMIGRKSKKVAAWAREASVRDVDQDTLVLVFRHSFHANALAADPELLVESVHEVLGGAWQVRCEVAGPQSGAAPAPSAPQPAAAPPPSRAPAPRGTAGSAATPATQDGDGDWPTTARPGGAAGAAPAPVASDPAPARPARSRATGGRQTGARSAPGRTSAGRSKDNDRPAAGRWDGAEEPPYDPEYDPPVGDARAYEGFDPGDEPGDEVVDERTARQTSEQQALQLLQQTLGAEKIGEVDAR
jgi:DNA polymerase-3 subunit gamma/tau